MFFDQKLAGTPVRNHPLMRPVRRAQLDRTPTAELEAKFVEIVGKLDMNKIAEAGSANLGAWDER